jgi:hypothetical protein
MSQELKIISKTSGVFAEVKQLKSVADMFTNPKIVQHIVNIAGSEHKAFAELTFFNEHYKILKKQLQDKATEKYPASPICPQSAYNCFVKTLSKGLSFNKEQRHVYLTTRNQKIGDTWFAVMHVSDSSQGMFKMAHESGQIKAINGVYLVYENDVFEDQGAGEKPIHKRALKDRGKPIAVWIELEKSDGTLVYPDIFTLDDMLSLMRYSHKERGRKKDDANDKTLNYANPLYGGINFETMDISFFKEKALKTALGRQFPKFDKEITQGQFPEQVQDEDMYGMELPSPGDVPMDHSHLVLPVDAHTPDAKESQDLTQTDGVAATDDVPF